jgi:hypothetical protein
MQVPHERVAEGLDDDDMSRAQNDLIRSLLVWWLKLQDWERCGRPEENGPRLLGGRIR